MGKDVLLGLAAMITAGAAVFGLQSWRRELKGKAEFDTARNFIRATYRLRDAIQDSRSRIISGVEFPDGYRVDSSGHEQADAYGHVYQNRWTSILQALHEFDAQTLEAEAFWPEIRTSTDALRQCVAELRAAMEAVIRNENVGGRDFQADKEFGNRMRSAVAASATDETNELSQRIKNAINGIEAIVRPAPSAQVKRALGCERLNVRPPVAARIFRSISVRSGTSQ